MAAAPDTHEATPPPKRKRSYSEHPTGRLHHQSAMPGSQYRLEINYLARQDSRDLPIVSSTNLTLRDILDNLYKYAGVLERNESVAANLGCKPLGPILMKRFERLFDGPVKVLNGPEIKISWMRVSELARQRPGDFRVVSKNGLRICAFHIDGYDAEISEEDYQILASGMADNMLPPQPIEEDEDKELKILDDLIHSLSEVIRDADSISGFGRQVKHRFEQRKTAILSKKESSAASVANGKRSRPAHSPPTPQSTFPPQGPPGPPAYPSPSATAWTQSATAFSRPTQEPPTSNGTGARHSLNDGHVSQLLDAHSHTMPHTAVSRSFSHDGHTPQNHELNHHGAQSPYGAGADVLLKAAAYSRDYSQSPVQHQQQIPDRSPFRAEMIARVDALEKGTDIYPPCDRCRRLNQPCKKNLSACDGCTKKHAKCNWEKVVPEEMDDRYRPQRNPVQAGTGIASSVEDRTPSVIVPVEQATTSGQPPDRE